MGCNRFMDESVLKRLQKVELEMLVKFDSFCREHRINYFLEGGTALGAIRHHGFIPWDDDVDVGMLRDDFNKLLSLRASLPAGLNLHLPSEKPEMAPLFAKICLDGTAFRTEETSDAHYEQGIFLDVFVYDQLLENPRMRRKQLRNARAWQSISYLYHSPHICSNGYGITNGMIKIASKAAHFILNRLTHPSQIIEKFERSANAKGAKTDLYSPFAYTKTPPMPRSVFLPTKDVLFEGHMMPVPNDIDLYLSNLYGDWETLPDEEDRHAHSPLYIRFTDGAEWHSADGSKKGS